MAVIQSPAGTYDSARYLASEDLIIGRLTMDDVGDQPPSLRASLIDPTEADVKHYEELTNALNNTAFQRENEAAKTTWSCLTALPLLMHPHRETGKRHQVLIASASNDVVNDIAARMAALVAEQLPGQDCIVVRSCLGRGLYLLLGIE